MADGVQAFRKGDYAKAEGYLKAARDEAEKFGSEDPRFATTLTNLAELYYAQGKYGEAAPLYKRSLATREKALGPDHPDVAQSLENYAALLRKTGRDAEAEKLEARAKAIRAKTGTNKPGR
jgi:tetratricopeptide (TPR) repeat protein